MHDKVDDFSRPVILHQYAWTGKLYEVAATRLLALSARSVLYDASLPRVLNSLVPRAVIESVKERFGNYFESNSPDWNFCYHSLVIVDSILFYDRALLVHYAADRSNGESVHRGITNQDHADFLHALDRTLFAAEAPIPGFKTVWNAIMSEYCRVKRETRSPKFPDVEMDKYLQALAIGVANIEDPQLRRRMRELLVARGWTEPQNGTTVAASGSTSPARKILSPKRVVSKLLRESRSVSGKISKLISARRPATETAQTEVFSVNSLEFSNAAEALDYALYQTRPRAAALPDHEALHEGVALPLPETAARRASSG
jgi:hypothetical protein